VMRKGYRREARSEGSAKQRCEPMNKNRIRGASAGRAGNVSEKAFTNPLCSSRESMSSRGVGGAGLAARSCDYASNNGGARPPDCRNFSARVGLTV
jgi:hypothetical protein